MHFQQRMDGVGGGCAIRNSVGVGGVGGVRRATGVLAAAALSLAAVGGALAQPTGGVPGAPSIPLTPAAIANGVENRITYEYGIEFVTIGSPGNAPLVTTGRANGRGSVSEEYRIGRFEITTAQWVQFMNAAYGRPSSQAIPHLLPPSGAFWGGQPDPTYSGPGQRWRVTPGQENRPVGNISWRMAAIYCNWLHNNQSTDRSAFLNGAYDVSTFGYVQGSIFTDQPTHNPGARFFIPTWDQWLKAAHYDPNRNGTGPGGGGWWQQPNASDTTLIYGPPSNPLAQANAAFNQSTTGVNPFSILLGAYPQTQSPWGLLDVAGATWEWTEGIYSEFGDPVARIFMGSAWTQPGGLDHISQWGQTSPVSRKVCLVFVSPRRFHHHQEF